MPYPNTDFPSAIDAAVNRVDAVDIVWADDFNYPDEQVRTVQDYLGIESFPNLPAFFRTIGATRCIAELGDPPVSCGYFRFDPTRRPSVNNRVMLFAHILASGAGVVGNVSIYDVGPATGPATPPVLIHEFPIAGPSGPQFHFSLDLLFDAAVPALGTIVLADRQYEIVLEVTGLNPGDIIFLGSAGLEVGGI